MEFNNSHFSNSSSPVDLLNLPDASGFPEDLISEPSLHVSRKNLVHKTIRKLSPRVNRKKYKTVGSSDSLNNNIKSSTDHLTSLNITSTVTFHELHNNYWEDINRFINSNKSVPLP